MNDSSRNKRIAKNTITLYIRMGITMLISFFTTRITLEVLGVEDYGLNNVIASVVSMFGFINGSMGTAVQRFFSVEIGRKNREKLSSVFGVGLYLHVIIAFITLLIAEVFAFFFLSKLNIPPDRLFAAHIVFQITILSLCATIVNVPFAAILRAHEEFSKIAIFDIVQSLLRLAVLFLLFKIDYDKIVVLSILNLGVSLSYVIGITFLAYKYDEVSFKFVRDKELIKDMVSFVSVLVFTVLAGVVNKQGLVIVVNLFFGLTVNAAYGIAYQVSRILETFAMNFKQSVVPQLMEAQSSSNSFRMNKLIFSGTKISFLLMLLISIPIIFEADFLLDLWLKKPPEYTSIFVKLIVVSVNINTFYYFIYQAVHASGKIKNQQIFISLSYFFSIIILYFIFKLGGEYYFVVIVPIIFSFIRNVIVLYFANRTISFPLKKYMQEVVFPCFLLSILILLAMLAPFNLLEESFLRLFVSSFISVFSTLIGGYFIVLNSVEREKILGFFKTIK
ncbi:MAG: hypothetical protein CSA15_07150 [Candidatus Delongbacteria bacterium]|nr:MAG: hypothetical protein CSA15_07150 [Candidatus Delongbacteria bacterium]